MIIEDTELRGMLGPLYGYRRPILDMSVINLIVSGMFQFYYLEEKSDTVSCDYCSTSLPMSNPQIL